jgi:alanine-glyoxylate transaminase/serine-glyoxylate transaminase/serine-pyruvate transaminase
LSDLHLMIPGPVGVSQDVLDAMAEPTLPHYGASWMPLYDETIGLLKRLFETGGDVLIYPGPGTSALEATMTSLVPRGEGICVLDNGFFGMRAMQVAEACGLRTWPVQAAWGEPIQPGDLRARLEVLIPQAEREGAPIRAVLIVHHETSTGVLNPLKGLTTVAQEFRLAVIVDAVASFGGTRIPVDAWGIDACVSVANKCLAVPPGVALMTISPHAWEMVKANTTPHGWYHDLRTWAWYIENWGDWHPYPTTLPTNNIVALNRTLKDIFEMGLDAHFASFCDAAARVRAGMAELGFGMLPDEAYAAPMISAFTAREGVKIGEMLAYLLNEHHLMLSGGLGDLRGKIFRVGHMGEARKLETIDALLGATREFLTKKGLL